MRKGTPISAFSKAKRSSPGDAPGATRIARQRNVMSRRMAHPPLPFFPRDVHQSKAAIRISSDRRKVTARRFYLLPPPAPPPEAPPAPPAAPPLCAPPAAPFRPPLVDELLLFPVVTPLFVCVVR